MCSPSSVARAIACGVAVLAFGAGPLHAQALGQGPSIPAPASDPHAKVLRVCADPNNLPFSNGKREGFENRLAEIVARDLGRTVAYAWWPQRRGFVRETLNAGRCDVIMGVPAGYELTLTTRPYYRSTYVFVSRHDRGLKIRSFDDPRLRRLRIGVHAIGADYDALPPVHALSHRGIVRNVRGYGIYGDYSKPNPPADLVRAVSDGAVDVAIGWGPLVGYFAHRSPTRLDVVPVSPQVDIPYTPFVFDIAMGVRRTDPALRDRLNQVLERRQAEIDRLLRSYGVPLIDSSGGAALQAGAAR
jgi:mxaJ protein